MEENNNTNLKVNIKIVAYIVFGLAIIFIGFICYDKFFNIEKAPVVNPTPINTISDDKIKVLNRVEIKDQDQVVKIEDKEFKIRKEITVDGAFLLIDDSIQELWDLETVYADFAYVTNKFILFTVAAQDGESIVYAIDKDGKEIATDDTDGTNEEARYQIHDITLNNDVIETKGHVFCGLDGNCPDKDLIIKYENNKISVVLKN